MVVGLLILAASLCLLVVANRPVDRNSDRQPLPAPDLTLPTPEARPVPALPAAVVEAPAW